MAKEQIIELRYGLDSFRSDWRHCSLGSDFLAETAFSTPRAKQIASTAINETLELAFRLGQKGTKSWVQATVKPGSEILLALDISISPEGLSGISSELTSFSVNAKDYYEQQLGTDTPGIFFGIGYLVADFGAKVKMSLQENILSVSCDVPLKDGAL